MIRMKNTRRIIAALLALTLLMGAALAEATQPAEDRAGNAVVIPEDPKHIVSLAPSTTQIVMDMGLTDLLVAVDTYSAQYWPDEVGALLQYDMMAPDNEALALLEPDVIFVTGMSFTEGENPFQTLINLGACVVVLPTSASIEDVEKDIAFIADVLNADDKGAELIESLQTTVDEVKAIGETIENKKTVLFEISALPYIYAPGDGTFLDEMIELIGAVNTMDGQNDWVFVSEEAALSANPDVILTSTDYIDDPVGEILAREGWDDVTAIKDGAVYPISSRTSGLPNQHIAEALVDMAKAVYPEAYAALGE